MYLYIRYIYIWYLIYILIYCIFIFSPFVKSRWHNSPHDSWFLSWLLKCTIVFRPQTCCLSSGIRQQVPIVAKRKDLSLGDLWRGNKNWVVVSNIFLCSPLFGGMIQLNYPVTRWWFQIFFLVVLLFGEDEPILTHIFGMGWFNHQLEKNKKLSSLEDHFPYTK